MGKWGWPEDVWFHVDKVSSAHVYLRLAPGQSLEALPQDVITDCAQLVKANSIQGNKMNDVDVVYTWGHNLKKTADMDVGQIGFHSQKAVKKIRLPTRDNAIVNRLNKTKEEKEVDFRAERDDKKKEFRKQEDAKKAEDKARKEAAELKSYDRLMVDDKMSSNKDGGNDSDDFM